MAPDKIFPSPARRTVLSQDPDRSDRDQDLSQVPIMSSYVDHTRRATGVPASYMGTTDNMGSHTNSGINMPADNLGQMMNQFGALTLPGAGYMAGHDANMVFANTYSQVHPFAAQAAYDPAMLSYLSGGYMPHAGVMPYTPGRNNVAAAHVPRELPSLDNRRSSYSTSATESTPATPFFGASGDRATGTRVASVDRDRSTYTTPSPQQVLSSAIMGQLPNKIVIPDPELDRILMQDPAIPRAVPAVFTDHVKTLDQCLDNRIKGNRNVYIRGLHPTTDDDLLLRYASRFGVVEQSKAIIDTSTGACKGFGFAKFKDTADSERCIRGFYRLGYEVGFARESFNARLKAEGDESSTNLYISNLPKDITETMLIHIFEPYQIASSKILRDANGNSRGVGFARFENRDVCERIIRNFNGTKLGPENQEMQVRYADTPAQKELKRITAERRQYRTNEYNISAYGTHAVGLNPTMYQQSAYGVRRSGSGGGSYTSSFRSGNGSGGYGGTGSRAMGRGGPQQNLTAPPTVTSDDGSGDEGVTIVESPTGNITAVSSPSAKKEIKEENV